MPDSSSFSMSTQSGTSTGVSTETTLNDESSSSTTTATTTIQTSSPDDSDGLAADVGGFAIATGDDTLASGSLSGELSDGGAVTSVDLSATMVAASESSDGETADAWTSTFAGVSDGTEVLFTSTVDTQSSEQNATGSTATSTSTTNLVAYDIDTEVSPTAPAAEDDSSDADDQPASSPTPTDVESDLDLEGEGDLNGNFATLEFTALAEGENTLVLVEGDALAIEDELSMAQGFIVLGVE